MRDGAIILSYYHRGRWRYLAVADNGWRCWPVTQKTVDALSGYGWIDGYDPVYTITPAGRAALKGGAK
jgi:hypothetical protein